MGFEWISLDDFVKEVSKSLKNNDLSKGDAHVHSYEKEMGGQRFRVSEHNRHTSNAAAPEISHGPVKHFVTPDKPKDSTGGLTNKNDSDIVPVIPAAEKVEHTVEPFPEHVNCEHCSGKQATSLANGSEDKFKYPTPKLPITGKTANEISLDDIAHSLHKHRFLRGDQWAQLPKEEQETHTKNHMLVHLNDDAQAALKKHVRRLIHSYMENKLEMMQLPRVGVDPEHAVDFFTDRIINEMKAHYRAGQEHNYATHDSKEYAQAKANSKIPVKRLFHQGMDPNKINNGKDLETFIRAKANDKWPIRIINKELPTGFSRTDKKTGQEVPMNGYSEILNSPAILAENSKRKEVHSYQNQLQKMERKLGIGEMSIDPAMDYDLKSLEAVAKKNDYVLEQHSAADGSNLQKIVITDNSGSEPKPVAEVDFAHGGKISDLKNKLAELVNPKQQETGPTPFKKFKQLSDQYDELKDKVEFLHKDYLDAREQYEKANVPPEEHINSIDSYASNALSVAEGLIQKLGNVPEIFTVKKVLTLVSEATENAVGSKNFQAADKSLKDAMQQAKDLASKFPNEPDTKALIMAVTKLQADINEYRSKATMPEQERENQLDKLFDKYKDFEDKLSTNNEKLMGYKTELAEAKAHPDLAEYLQTKESKEAAEKELETLTPLAKQAWKPFEMSSLQAAGEGENAKGEGKTGNYAEGEASYAAKMNELNAADREWYDKVPDKIDFNDEKAASDAAQQLLDAYKHVHHPGEFIFGDNPNVTHGIIHVANHFMSHQVLDDTQELLTQLAKQHPTGKGVPPEFLQSGNSKHLASNPTYWGKLFKLSPKLVAHYALKFSDYATTPYSHHDVVENEVQDEHGKPYFNLFQADIARMVSMNDKTNTVKPNKNLEPVYDNEGTQISWKLKPQHEWVGMPIPKVLQFDYVNLLRQFGNAAVQHSIKKRPELAPVFELVRELNHAPKKMEHSSADTPGTLRRQLKRRMDVFYGQTFGKYPDWHHKRHPEEEGDWVNSLRNIKTNEEKSLVIYEDDFRKAVRLIVSI